MKIHELRTEIYNSNFSIEFLMNTHLAIVIPCYNEALVVRETYNRLNAIFTPQPYQVEFIFLNIKINDLN